MLTVLKTPVALAFTLNSAISTVCASTLAHADPAEHILQIEEISQQIGRRIVVDDAQVGPADVKLARAIREVLIAMESYMGPLNRWNGPIKFQGETGDALAYAAEDGTYFNTETFHDFELRAESYKINAAHEIGHEVLRTNISYEGKLKILKSKTTGKGLWMLSPYHETFASLNVVLFNGGDPTAEMYLSLDTGSAPKKADQYRWDMYVPMNEKVPAKKYYQYRFFRAAKHQIWKKHLANAKRKDYANLMIAFIRATERHLVMRMERGELEMKTVKWTRRAPQLNREFAELFDLEYAGLKVSQ